MNGKLFAIIMSYLKFSQAVNDYLVYREANNLPNLDSEDSDAFVRDEWMRDGKYKELIIYILENWDSGNCDDFSRPLSLHLIEIRENNLFMRLWKGIIRNRLEKLWRDIERLKSEYPKVTLKEIKTFNVKGFNQFSSKEGIKRAVAWRRLYIMDGLSEFIVGLNALNETEEVARQTKLLEIVSNLEKPLPQPSADKRKIDEQLFWELIEASNKESLNRMNFMDKVKLSLEKFYPKELRNFHKIFLTKINELNTWEHWALAYIVRRGCGDDAFDYFKAWVVSKGRKAFDAVKNFSEAELVSIFEEEDPQLEEIFYLAEVIYESKTSEFMPPVKVKSSKLTGKKWEEDKLAATFPSLSKLFNYK
jgi:hypothetical protein